MSSIRALLWCYGASVVSKFMGKAHISWLRVAPAPSFSLVCSARFQENKPRMLINYDYHICIGIGARYVLHRRVLFIDFYTWWNDFIVMAPQNLALVSLPCLSCDQTLWWSVWFLLLWRVSLPYVFSSWQHGPTRLKRLQIYGLVVSVLISGSREWLYLSAKYKIVYSHVDLRSIVSNAIVYRLRPARRWPLRWSRWVSRWLCYWNCGGCRCERNCATAKIVCWHGQSLHFRDFLIRWQHLLNL